MYDKERRTFSQVSIKAAAQSRGYYDQDVEEGLAQDIERPGNAAIDTLRRQHALNNTERTQLSMYLLTMATRGPRHRRKALEEVAPKALESTIKEIEADIQKWIDESGGDPLAIARMMELHAVRENLATTPPKNILDLIRIPFWSEETVLCVHNMVWRIIPAPSSTYYLTCDTPTHLSEWAGVGTPQSELTFPISKDLALIGSHTGQPATIEHLPAQADLVAEVNRRMVNCAERFIFSHVKDVWIAELADTPPPFNRIQWLAPV